MEECIFMQFDNKLVEGSSEKVDRTYIKLKKFLKMVYYFKSLYSVQKIHFFIKTKDFVSN